MTSTNTAPASFDFGLSEQQEERARRLHRESIVVDLLSQHAGSNIFDHFAPSMQAELQSILAAAGSPMEAFLHAVYWPYELSKQGRSDLISAWFQQSGLTCGTYGIGVHDGTDALENEWQATTQRYADLPWLRYVTTAAEIRAAKRDGLIAFYAHCQPTTSIPRDLDCIDSAYSKGLRSLMLTYNSMDHVGVGCTERVDAGLSNYGVEVVRHCNAIGMIVDVSHCGPLTTLDACRHSTRPVTANHSGAGNLFTHARNKSDEALRAIAATGGLIGIVAVPAFLTDAPEPSIEHMLDHVDYVASRVGWRHVAIGTDWPLQAPEALLQALLSPDNRQLGFRRQDRLDVTRRLRGFDDCRDLPNITRGLVKRGYGDEEIRGILGENALRVFSEVCG
jgi:membrane dipeptidase